MIDLDDRKELGSWKTQRFGEIRYLCMHFLGFGWSVKACGVSDVVNVGTR